MDWEQEFDNDKALQDEWKDEDADDNVAESWDAEPTTKAAKAAVKKPKKSKEEIIAEREAKRKEEEDKAKADAANELTELQRQNISRMAELDMLGDTFGLTAPKKPSSSHSIDNFQPESKEDFVLLAISIQEKLSNYEKSPHYASFVDGLVRNIVAGVDVDGLRKMSTMLNAMANEKQKLEKGKQKAKKSAAKGKIKVTKAVNNMDNLHEGGVELMDYDDDYDDFI